MESCLPGEKPVLVLAFSLLWAPLRASVFWKSFACPWEGRVNDLFQHFSLSRQQCPGTANTVEPGAGWRENEHIKSMANSAQVGCAVSYSGLFSFELVEGRAGRATRGEPGLREMCVPRSGCWEGNPLLYLSGDWGTQELLWEQHCLCLWLFGCSLIAAKQVPGCNPPRGKPAVVSTACSLLWQCLRATATVQSLLVQGIDYEQDWDERRQLLRDRLKFGIFLKFYGKNKFDLKWVLELVAIYGQPQQYSPLQHFPSECEQWKAEAREKEFVSQIPKVVLNSGGTFWWQILAFLGSTCVFRKMWC